MHESQVDDALDAYLDGRLGPAESLELADRLASDEALRRRVELSRTIDHALTRLHGPTARLRGEAAEVMTERRVDPSAEAEPPSGPSRRAWRLTAIAGVSVAIALVTVGTVLVVGPRWRLARDRALVATAPTTPVEVYRAMERRGFEFEWACNDAAEFADYTRSQFGQAFLIAQSPAIEVLGWAYPSAVLGSPTGVLLGRERGVPAVLLVVPRAAERPQATGVIDGLNVVRRALGDLVVYEVSPRPQVELLTGVVLTDARETTADGP